MPMRADLPDNVVLSVLGRCGTRPFSTLDFADRVRSEFPGEWGTLEGAYRVGGRGAGARYTAFTAIAQILNRWSKRGLVEKLDYRTAPSSWGARRILYWRYHEDVSENLYPDEAKEPDALHEGGRIQVTVNRYERDPVARKRCIEHYGTACAACRLDFGVRYGPLGAGFIHIHHSRPLSEIGEDYVVDPVRDLIPVCPNCHAMLHRGPEVLTIAELRALLSENESGSN